MEEYRANQIDRKQAGLLAVKKMLEPVEFNLGVEISTRCGDVIRILYHGSHTSDPIGTPYVLCRCASMLSNLHPDTTGCRYLQTQVPDQGRNWSSTLQVIFFKIQIWSDTNTMSAFDIELTNVQVWLLDNMCIYHNPNLVARSPISLTS